MLSVALAATACTAKQETSRDSRSPSFSSTSVATTQPIAGVAVGGQTGDNMSRERAIEIASAKMQPGVVARATISAELSGSSWVVVFDNLNATADELRPFPFWHDGPPDLSGKPPVDPYPGIWQTVRVELDAATGDLRGVSAFQQAKPGPYMSETEAVERAREAARTTDFGWESSATVQAYLERDMWTVIFAEEGNPEHRITVTIGAVDGDPVVIKKG